MKLVFAAAAAAALIASIPAHAASTMSAGIQPAQECAAAAARQSLTERQLNVAMAACNTALKSDLSQTATAGTLVNRGLLQVAAHNDSAAMADFDAGLSRDANLSAGYMNRGAALLRAGRYDSARADFDRAIALNAADLHVAYFNRGEAQEASGNLIAAYHDYRKAQELAPGFQPAQLELARFQVAPRRLADNH
jgi:tetratricopeptide (TPR) repeat protein